jgi:hypothetical protein
MKRLAIFAAFFLLSPLAHAAIARDTSTTIVNPASGSNNSITLSGSNRYLACNILEQGDTITGFTYGGTSLALQMTLSTNNVATGDVQHFYGLANPASGANNLVVTYTGAATIIIDCSSYTGAQQTNTLEATSTATGAAGSTVGSVTTLTDNDWLIGYGRASSAITAGSNTNIVTNNSSRDFIDSGGPQSPAGSWSLNFTTSGQWGILVGALKPFVVDSNKWVSLIWFGWF